MIQHDLPPADFPVAVDPTERVFPFADEDVGFGLHPVAVDQKAALDRDVLGILHRRLRAQELDVRDHVAEAGERLLGPVHAGQDLLHAPGERVLALVEPVDVLALARELALQLAELDVAADRHPVPDVISEEIQPIFVAPLVEDLRLVVEEVRHLPLEEELRHRVALIGHRRYPRRGSRSS